MSTIKDELAAHDGKTLKVILSTKDVIVGKVEELEEDHAVIRDLAGGRQIVAYEYIVTFQEVQDLRIV